jgi:hypothetical protein
MERSMEEQVPFQASAEQETAELLEVPQQSESPSTEEVEEKHISSNVCDTCLHDNLLHSIGIANCSRCRMAYCLHFTSKIDPQYCIDCCSELSVEKTVISKTYEHYNEETDTTTRYSRKARQIKVEGLDWLLAQRKIPSLTDGELDMAIEYHRQLASLMLTEAEKRRAEKLHRYAGVKIVPVAPTGTTTSTVEIKKTVVKNTQTKNQNKAQSLISALLAKGLTMEQITQMIMGKK